MEDFYLVKRVASHQDPVKVASPVECAEDAVPSQVNPNNLVKLSRDLNEEVENICFRDVPDEEEIIREAYFLVYEPQFPFVPPPPPPGSTPTPTPGARVAPSEDPLESEEDFRWGWKVYYALR